MDQRRNKKENRKYFELNENENTTFQKYERLLRQHLEEDLGHWMPILKKKILKEKILS